MKRMSEDMCPSVYTNFPIDTTVDAHALDSAVITGYLEATSEKVYTQNEVIGMYEDIKAEIRHFMYDINAHSSESDYACNHMIDVVNEKIKALVACENMCESHENHTKR